MGRAGCSTKPLFVEQVWKAHGILGRLLPCFLWKHYIQVSEIVLAALMYMLGLRED